MEFDIVELGNVNGRLRLSMQFDIVDNGLALMGVRLDKTSYSWSMEFDIVELERKTMAEREAEENCWITWMRHYKQGLRQFGYYPRRKKSNQVEVCGSS